MPAPKTTIVTPEDVKQFTKDVVKEHGEWCLARCYYPENRQRVQEILDANEKEG